MPAPSRKQSLLPETISSSSAKRLRVLLPLPLADAYDYRAEGDAPPPGSFVAVPLGGRQVLGVVCRCSSPQTARPPASARYCDPVGSQGQANQSPIPIPMPTGTKGNNFPRCAAKAASGQAKRSSPPSTLFPAPRLPRQTATLSPPWFPKG